MNDDKPALYWGVLSSAVIFGVGFVSGVIFHKIFPHKNSGVADAIARKARVVALRAKNYKHGSTHKMVFVVRTDLGMGKGKIAAQCSHAAVMCYQYATIHDPVNLELWDAVSRAKICLKTDGEDTLLDLYKKAKEKKLVAAYVQDAGHTQVSRFKIYICPYKGNYWVCYLIKGCTWIHYCTGHWTCAI